jgi:uncharacterized membrane protein
MKKFISLSTLLILTRLADAQTTYLYTPDLKREANPLVSLFGFGWTGSIIVQIIGLTFCIYALWVYIFKTVQLPAFDKNISLTKFIGLFHFRDTRSFLKMFYRLPTNKNSLLYSIGYIFTYTLIIFSTIVSCSTTFLILSKSYRNFYSAYSIPVFLYTFALILIVFFSSRFYKQEMSMRVSS